MRILLFFFLFISSAYADFRPCIDTLGAPKYPNELRAIPNHFGIGSFAQTFGDFFPVAKKELERGREKIRVNLTWSDTHSYGDRDIPVIKKEAKRYQILCKLYPGKIELATFTEHNLNRPDKYHDIVQKSAPDCTIVNTPWKGALSKKYKNEIHGGGKPPSGAYNFSYDGTNSVDSNVSAAKSLYRASDMLCMWHPRLNGKWNMADKTPRPQRQAWPSKELLQSLIYLFTERGTFTLEKKFLVKSHSERHNAGDIKGDKLLIISPYKTDSIKLKHGALTEATLPYYGPYTEGGFRFYSSSMGYKLGANLDIWQGGRIRGTINAGFRGLSYR